MGRYHVRSAPADEGAWKSTKGVEVVYYVLAFDGIVKIGTSADLLNRLRAIDNDGRRSRDNVLAIEFGGQALERARHEQFSHLLDHGREYFRLDSDLSAHIESLRSALGARS